MPSKNGQDLYFDDYLLSPLWDFTISAYFHTLFLLYERPEDGTQVWALTSRSVQFHIKALVSDSLSVQKILFLGYGFYRKPWKSGTPGRALSVVQSLCILAEESPAGLGAKVSTA